MITTKGLDGEAYLVGYHNDGTGGVIATVEREAPDPATRAEMSKDQIVEVMGSDFIPDAKLDAWERGTAVGYRNAVPYLRPLTPRQRALAIHDGTIRMNMTPGWRFSDAVGASAQEVAAGHTPYIDANRQIMKDEQERRIY